MINKKSMLLLFVSLIVLCLTVSAVSAADNDVSAASDAQTIDTTEIQNTVDTETNSVQTDIKGDNLNKTTSKDVKSAGTYYVSTTGSS